MDVGDGVGDVGEGLLEMCGSLRSTCWRDLEYVDMGYVDGVCIWSM